MRIEIVRRCIPFAAVAAFATLALAQSAPAPRLAAAPAHEGFQNLKVLPTDIPPAELRAVMNGFTRALGVRCLYCHVGEEGKPFRAEDFQKDDKPEKLKAREMLRMVRDINDKYLPTLEHRVEPALRVECVTCHRGTTEPRTLQAVLQHSYDTGGRDSVLARYHALRDRYYGRATYDFGEVPLADVAGTLAEGGHDADAESLLALNVSMNPGSRFARRQWLIESLSSALQRDPGTAGATIHDARARYGEPVVSEELVNSIAYGLLGRHETAAAVAAFRQNAADHPSSGNAFDSLGEGLAQGGDVAGAKKAYARALELDPANTNAKQKLEALGHGK